MKIIQDIETKFGKMSETFERPRLPTSRSMLKIMKSSNSQLGMLKVRMTYQIKVRVMYQIKIKVMFQIKRHDIDVGNDSK